MGTGLKALKVDGLGGGRDKSPYATCLDMSKLALVLHDDDLLQVPCSG